MLSRVKGSSMDSLPIPVLKYSHSEARWHCWKMIGHYKLDVTARSVLSAYKAFIYAYRAYESMHGVFVDG